MRHLIWLGLIVLSVGIIYAYTPIYTEHKDLKQVDTEFSNIEESVQGNQFTVYNATPILSELRDREVVIVSSMGWTALMIRVYDDIYAIKLSCTTVRR